MNNKGQADYRLASHIGLWIFAIGISVWLIYSATHTHTENNRYDPGSNPQETTVNKGFLSSLFEFNLSCIPRGLINKTYNNGVNNAVSTNSQTNSVK